MREIKFRAWDGRKMYFTDHGDIGRFGDCFEWSPYCFVIPKEDYPVPNTPEVSEWKVMQFTGLKDKNGKEIYEGDILKWPGDKYRYYKIEWLHGGFVMISMGDGTGDYNLARVYNDGCHSEIIGNIYEKPELVKP